MTLECRFYGPLGLRSFSGHNCLHAYTRAFLPQPAQLHRVAGQASPGEPVTANMSQFDQQYYERFYADVQTRAVSPIEQQRQADFISAYLRYLDVPVTRILDIGCGLGVLLAQLSQHFPGAQTIGVEYSDYLCAEYGWQRGSVVDFQDQHSDLVICNDVLGYLDKKDCRSALQNLATLTRHALYISVLTEEDMDICDTEHTDMQQNLRSHKWYKKHLAKHFVAVGGGLFLKKPLEFAVWQVERAD